MLTKWGKKLATMSNDGNAIYNFPLTGAGDAKAVIIAKNPSGTEFYTGPIALNASNNLLTSITASGSSSSYGIAVGTGDTPATENDYTIETMITSGLSLSSTRASEYDSEAATYNAYLNMTFSNSTASDIVIKEICKFVKLYKSSTFGASVNTSAVNGMCCMVDRTVLETPLTVPANGSAVLRYGFAYPADEAPASEE